MKDHPFVRFAERHISGLPKISMTTAQGWLQITFVKSKCKIMTTDTSMLYKKTAINVVYSAQ